MPIRLYKLERIIMQQVNFQSALNFKDFLLKKNHKNLYSHTVLVN